MGVPPLRGVGLSAASPRAGLLPPLRAFRAYPSRKPVLS